MCISISNNVTQWLKHLWLSELFTLYWASPQCALVQPQSSADSCCWYWAQNPEPGLPFSLLRPLVSASPSRHLWVSSGSTAFAGLRHYSLFKAGFLFSCLGFMCYRKWKIIKYRSASQWRSCLRLGLVYQVIVTALFYSQI